MREVLLSTLGAVGVLALGCGQMYRSPKGLGASPAPAPDQITQGPPGSGQAAGEGGRTPAPPSTPAAPEPTAPATGGDPARLVAAHNRVRAQHCAPPLTWSTTLAQVAQQWANTLRDRGCKFEHSGGQYGENLAAGTTGAMDPEAVVAMWYDEVKGYSFKQPGFSMQTGHFTQVVWRGTTSVGCGMAQCGGNDIWVCNYDPPGNWEGQYPEQVRPVGCK